MDLIPYCNDALLIWAGLQATQKMFERKEKNRKRLSKPKFTLKTSHLQALAGERYRFKVVFLL